MVRRPKDEKELILLFKNDNCPTEADWKRFCRRYATRDVTTIVKYIRRCYRGVFHVSGSFAERLKEELARAA